MQGTLSRGRWLLAFLMGMLAWFVALIGAGSLAAALPDSGGPVPGWLWVLRSVVQVLLATAGLALALRLVRVRLPDLGLVKKSLASDVLIGVAVGLLLPLLQLTLIIPHTGGAARSDVIASRAIMGDSLGGLVGAIIMGWLVGGFAEELFFRGYIFYTLRGWLPDKRLGVGVALLVSTLLFGLLHAYQGVVGMLDTGLFALLMALLYLWRGRLAAPMIAHGLNNMLLFIGLYLLY